MGLLDGALGGIVGNMLAGAVGQSPLTGAALQLIQQHGGLPGLLQKLEQAGLGAQVASWVGTGPNLATTGAQLAQALGPQAISQLAAQLGVPHAQASDGLAALLPQLVSQMTPAGAVPEDHASLLTQALGALGR